MYDENYPEPLSAQSSRGSLWRVILLIVFFVAVAGYFAFFGNQIRSEWLLLFLGGLAVAGVFCLFALASGLFVIGSGAEGRTVSRSWLDSSPDGVVIANKKGEISYANRKYLQMSEKISAGAPVGVIRLFANQPEAAESMHRLALAAREGRHAIEDIRLTRNFDGTRVKESKPIWNRISVRLLPPLQNKGESLLAWTISDISVDRDRQENAFLELQRAIDYLDHAPAGFFSANKEGSVQYINATLADWLGIDLAEFEPGDLRLDHLVRGDGANLLMGGRSDGEIKTQIIDIDLVHRNGTSFPVRLLHRAARLAEGELGETRTLVLDRAGGAETKDDLRAAEVKFSRFFNDTPFAIATLDAKGKIVSTNAPFARIFNISTTEKAVEGAEFSELIDKKHMEAFQDALVQVNQNLSQIEPVDANLADDEERSVRLYLSASEKTADLDEQVIIYALDMTDYTKLQAQFVQAQKMQAIGQLAGGVAHDFNNVLTAIIGFADLLFLRHKPTDPSFADIMQIKQSANRAAGLVKQLLAYSRQQTLRPQILEVTTQIDDYNIFLKHLMGEKVSLSVNHGRDVWPIKADAVQLEQVVLNLAINARDAMPDGGEIQLKTRNVTEREAATFSYKGMPAAEYVLIEVEDQGTGIPEEVLEKMYEPYFSTKEQGKGTGLGLSMVYGIIKQTGGFIYADTQMGKGTNFLIFFPRYVASKEEMEKISRPAPEKKTKDLTGNERILIVEDDEIVRAISVRTLRTTGYEVFEADGGDEALEVLDEIDNKIDLMISDVMMPGMDGPSLLVEVRKRLPDLKVIFVSGFARMEMRDGLADDRSVEFLPKPYNFDQINSKVKEVLSGASQSEGSDS
ncbi:Sensory box histidine kinase/response regulator [hydrothermal vent metagenome]|uniref:Sensory box histidine kinase/response regulator n=1 Tax=hydrothermal vent metagenome TaxID=652676 RepID=A0A3B0TM44_9ZZZZ